MQQKATGCDQKDRKFICLGLGGCGQERQGKSHGDGAFVEDLTYRPCVPGHLDAFGCKLLQAKVSTGCPPRCPPNDAFWHAKKNKCGLEIRKVQDAPTDESSSNAHTGKQNPRAPIHLGAGAIATGPYPSMSLGDAPSPVDDKDRH